MGEHVTCTKEIKNVYQILVAKPEGTDHLVDQDVT
jgi:hypothetical protein